MRSDSDRNMSASLTRITRQVSRTFDLNGSTGRNAGIRGFAYTYRIPKNAARFPLSFPMIRWENKYSGLQRVQISVI